MHADKHKGVAWLTTAMAAEYLGFVHADGTPNARAFRKWLRRQPANRPKRHYLGRMLRFRRVDLDSCLETLPEVEARRYA